MRLTCSDLFCTFAAGGALEIHGFGNTLNTLLLLLPPEGGGGARSKWFSWSVITFEELRRNGCGLTLSS